MGKLDKGNAFSESCCDGGATVNDQSCQPCGCDRGANYVCAWHRSLGVELEPLVKNSAHGFLLAVELDNSIWTPERLAKHLADCLSGQPGVVSADVDHMGRIDISSKESV